MHADEPAPPVALRLSEIREPYSSVVERRRRVAVTADGKKVSAILAQPPTGIETARALVVLAHGAGNDMEHPLITAVADGLAAAGYLSVRFNFPYREAGRKTPDPTQRLEATWLAVTDAMSELLEGRRLPLVVGGKSMGGRIAAQLVADKVLTADALVFLGYPLHRAGDEQHLRDAPLREIAAPMLFLTGSKDRLCRIELLEGVCKELSTPTTLHVVPGADHGLDIPRLEPAAREQLRADLVEATVTWLHKTIKQRGHRGNGNSRRR